jgi:hypothetical protein
MISYSMFKAKKLKHRTHAKTNDGTDKIRRVLLQGTTTTTSVLSTAVRKVAMPVNMTAATAVKPLPKNRSKTFTGPSRFSSSTPVIANFKPSVIFQLDGPLFITVMASAINTFYHLSSTTFTAYTFTTFTYTTFTYTTFTTTTFTIYSPLPLHLQHFHMHHQYNPSPMPPLPPPPSPSSPPQSSPPFPPSSQPGWTVCKWCCKHQQCSQFHPLPGSVTLIETSVNECMYIARKLA